MVCYFLRALMSHITISPLFSPTLDPGFVPAVLWNRAYEVKTSQSGRPITLALSRDDGTCFHWSGRLLPAESTYAADTIKYLDRLVKFLLWQKGGNRIAIAGADDVVAILAETYGPEGKRKFDREFIGTKIFGGPITVTAVASAAELPAEHGEAMPLGRHLQGCRIGFDLGGSDRKCAAVIDGEVVFSEEIVWDPYFQNDPQYHIEGIHDSLTRAAAHLPRVDAIGGSSAGVIMNNQVRASSLFRGVSAQDYEQHVRNIFTTLRDQRWKGVPFEVVNDGEVTALAGSMALQANSVLGVAMGTSEAVGYVDAEGHIKPWLNELAFAPVDYREDGPLDEWSGDRGCGALYFSQQAVARLAPAAGFDFGKMPFPEQLVEVQKAMKLGDERAAKIYQSIGVCFGYSIAHYADFYQIEHLLILGRVTSGEGGEIIIREAEKVLAAEFPQLSIKLVVPDEKTKRHGQAVAAASLPFAAL
jgi:predicted NBD/HSP70 family sugar kinase